MTPADHAPGGRDRAGGTETPNARYERLAAAFLDETGMLAPGKDVPAGFGGPSFEERSRAWTRWLFPKGTAPAPRAPSGAGVLGDDEHIVRHPNGHLMVERVPLPSREAIDKKLASIAKAYPYLVEHASHIDGEFDNALSDLRRMVDMLYAATTRPAPDAAAGVTDEDVARGLKILYPCGNIEALLRMSDGETVRAILTADRHRAAPEREGCAMSDVPNTKPIHQNGRAWAVVTNGDDIVQLHTVRSARTESIEALTGGVARVHSWRWYRERYGLRCVPIEMCEVLR